MNRKRRFAVTSDHLALLRGANVLFQDFIEWGAPAIDPKRPYGNGDLYGDMARLLGIEPTGDEWEPFDIATRADFDRLHRETATALQVALVTQSFERGTYEADDYRDNWERIA